MSGSRRVLLVVLASVLVIAGGLLAWDRAPAGISLGPVSAQDGATQDGTTQAGGTRPSGSATSGTAATVKTSPLDPCPPRAAGTEAAGEAARRLPTLALPCLSVGTGGDVALADPPGVPMVLNVWASWCGPCRTELPLFQQLYEGVPEQVQTLGIVVRDTAEAASAYATEVGLTFPSVLDTRGDFLAAEGINALPVTYFVRADGTVAGTHIGPVASYPDLIGLLSQYLDVTVAE